MMRATELEWLIWFYQNCDFGPSEIVFQEKRGAPMTTLYTLLLSLLLVGVAEAEPIFTCKEADCSKAIIDRQTWMAQRAANPHSFLCVDTTNGKNYLIVPCELMGGIKKYEIMDGSTCNPIPSNGSPGQGSRYPIR